MKTNVPPQLRHKVCGCDPIFAPNIYIVIADISAPPSLSSSSSHPSISTGSCDSEPIFHHKQVLCPSRRNEHLAVLLPKSLWKVVFIPFTVECCSSCVHSPILSLRVATTFIVELSFHYLSVATYVALSISSISYLTTFVSCSTAASAVVSSVAVVHHAPLLCSMPLISISSTRLVISL